MLTNPKPNRRWRLPAVTAGLMCFLAGCTPPGPRALLDGERLLNKGQPAEAVRRLRTAVEYLPGSAPAWNHLGLAYHLARQRNEAEESYLEALRLDRNLAIAYYNLGCLYLEAGDAALAIDSLWAYVGLQPQAQDGWIRLGQAQMRGRKWEQAERSFVAALRLDGRHPEALNGLGVVYQQRRRSREAWQCFTNALHRQPGFAPAWYNLGVIAQQYGAPAVSVKAYRQYAALRPEMARQLGVQALIDQLEPPPRTPAPPAAALPSDTTSNPPSSAVTAETPPASPLAPPTHRPPESAAQSPPSTTRQPPGAQPRPPPSRAATDPATSDSTPPPPVDSPSPSPAEPVPAVAQTTDRLTTDSPPDLPVTTASPAPKEPVPSATTPTPTPSPPAPIRPPPQVASIASPNPNPNPTPASVESATNAANSATTTASNLLASIALERVELPPANDLATEVRDESSPIPTPGDAQPGTPDQDPSTVMRPMATRRPVPDPDADGEDRRGFWSRANPVRWFGSDDESKPAAETDPDRRDQASPAPADSRWRWANPTAWFRRDDPSAPPTIDTRSAQPIPSSGSGFRTTEVRTTEVPTTASQLPNPSDPPVSTATNTIVAATTIPIRRPSPADAPPAPPRRYAYLRPEPPAPGNRSAAQSILAQAIQEHRAGRTQNAIALYRKSLALDPGSFDAHQKLAVAYLGEGDIPRSLAESETALALRPESTIARLNLALALDRGGFPADAAAEAERIVSAQPDDVSAHLLLGNLYSQKLGLPDRARPHYLKVIDLEPEHPQSTAIRRWLAGRD